MSRSTQMKLGYRLKEAAEFIGSRELLARCEAAGWITPKVRQHKLTIYDGSELAVLWQRICAGDMPPLRPRKTPRKEASHA